MRYLIIFVVLFLFESTAFGYDTKQLSVLRDAKNIAETYLCYEQNNGKTDCLDQTLMGMTLQESSAGKHKSGDDGKSLGLVHVTYKAAQDVIMKCGTKKYFYLCGWFSEESMDRTTINVKLQTNDYYNLVVAAMYFRLQYDYYLEHGYSAPWTRALKDYNAGPGVAKNMTLEELNADNHVWNVKKRIRNLKRYNRKYKKWVWA